jgi:hypothetical protein
MFPPNVLIRIDLNGGLAPIQNLRPGHKVVTHKGRLMEIMSLVNETYEGFLIKVKVTGYTQSLEVSPEQQFLTYPNLTILKGIPETDPLNPSFDRSFDIQWKSANQLKTTDYIQLPAPIRPQHLQIHNIKGGYLPLKQGVFTQVGAVESRPFKGFLHNLIVDQDASFIASGFTVRT